jgi:hypothetical protein
MSLVPAFVATIVCIAATASVAVADYLHAGFVLKNSAEVHVPVSALPYLATLKLAGAVGLVVGLVAMPWLGVAAGVGLTLFFVGAVAVHIKTGVLYNIAFPAAFLLLAITSAGYLLHLARS